ncbi:MAG: cation diffusion facilitator family transporter [Bacilli bacterium]|nr:cation transporter [Acholeplasmataceae bacterium]
MVKFLAKIFIKDYENYNKPKVRANYGKLGGIFGLVTNVILCVVKIISGLVTSSIAIIAEGINNLSDAGSSIITLIGFKLSKAPADAEHPYGHERIEYVAGLIISIIIMIIGVNLTINSIQKIINPTTTIFSYLVIALLIVSILVKLLQVYVYRSIGKLIDSQTLIATATDSLNDCISTTAVIVSLIVSKLAGFNLDGYMGLVVSLFIIYSGIKLIKDTSNLLIGVAPDEEFVKKISDKLHSYDGVLGIHDLIVHSYGPHRTFVTVHVEVDSEIDINESHDMIDNIEYDFKKDLNIELVVHMDPVNTNDPVTISLREKVEELLHEIDPELTFHDFRVVKGVTHTNLIFDVELPPQYDKTPKEVQDLIQKKVSEYDPKLYTVINIDQNYVYTISTRRPKI